MPTPEEREAMLARLTQAHADAQRALEDATQALQQAQLRAVTEDVTIPGRLADAVAEARTRLSNCEGALIAFGRNDGEEREAEQRAARTAIEGAVDDAVAEYQRSAEALIVTLEQLMTTGAGGVAATALERLRRTLAPVHTNLLGDSGWMNSNGLRTLRALPPEEIVGAVVRQCLQTDGRGVFWAREQLQAMCDEIKTHVRAHPATWPAIN